MEIFSLLQKKCFKIKNHLGIVQFESFEDLKNTSVSGRSDFLQANKEKFVNGDVQSKLIGIGFVENIDGELQELKLTEMDYYDILFCNGIFGCILFAIPILAFFVEFIRYTMINKKRITIEFIYSMLMAAVVALLAGHVFTSPAVCIYIVIILLKYNFDIRERKENNEKDNHTIFTPRCRRGRKKYCNFK